MIEIRRLLEQDHVPFVDKQLGWPARASSYARELWAALGDGHTAVLVELEPDIELPPGGVLIVDHHGPEAGHDRPTSLEQVFRLLGLPATRWTRRLALVAANDRGYVDELLDVGATRDEVERIRAEDRAAQGITAEEERVGADTVASAMAVASGRLLLVRLSHERTATVTDRLHPRLSSSRTRNVLVTTPQSTFFSGDGIGVQALVRSFPTGWYGGALPNRGYWGHSPPVAGAQAVLEAVLAAT